MKTLQPCLFEKLNSFSKKTGYFNWHDILKHEIECLLNNASLSKTLYLDEFEEVETSVLNHGLPSLSKLIPVTTPPVFIASHINRILATYEPRLDPNSIYVVPIIDDDKTTILAILFDIYAKTMIKGNEKFFNIKISFDYSNGVIKAV